MHILVPVPYFSRMDTWKTSFIPPVTGSVLTMSYYSNLWGNSSHSSPIISIKILFCSMVFRSRNLQLLRFSSESWEELGAMFELGPEGDPSRAAQPNPPVPGSHCQHEAAEVSECCKPTPRDQHTPRDHSVTGISPWLLCRLSHP